jgi:hypothetical protein
MTRAKDIRDAPPEGIEVQPGIYHHPRSPDASVEKLLSVAGILKLERSIPLDELRRMMHDEDEEEETIDDHAGG